MSFGYSPGDGTGVDQQFFGRFSGTRYVNTGGTLAVGTVDLVGSSRVVTGIKSRIALYSDYEGFPQVLLCYSDELNDFAIGTNTYTFPTTVEIPAGLAVHVFFHIHSGNTNVWFNGSTKTLGGRWFNQVGDIFPLQTWEIAPWTSPLDRILPAVVNGGGSAGASDTREALAVSQPLTPGVPDVRETLAVAEPLSGSADYGDFLPRIRETLAVNEPLTEAANYVDGLPRVRECLCVLEPLHPVPPELPMSTTPFPGFGNSISNPAIPAALDPFNSPLPGLAFSVHKKPMFNTRISESASGHEITNQLMQYPKWEFNLTYEFLEDRSGANSSLKTIVGFFCERAGRFDSFLFKDPDDYEQVRGWCGDSDGTITQFPFCRTFGGFVEKVGQVDTDNTINVYTDLNEAHTLPANPGGTPVVQTVAVNFPPSGGFGFTADLGVTRNGVAMTAVPGPPTTATQYSFDPLTGIYSFWSTNGAPSAALVISYTNFVDPADYTVTMPNLIVFDTAPTAGAVYADFQFFFACRFLEDQQDYEKFCDKLWNLQECDFRSFPQ